MLPILSIRKGDNFVILKSKKVVEIHNFLSTTTADYIVGKVFTKYSDAYSVPCQSSSLGIYLVSDLEGRFNTYSISDIVESSTCTLKTDSWSIHSLSFKTLIKVTSNLNLIVQFILLYVSACVVTQMFIVPYKDWIMF